MATSKTSPLTAKPADPAITDSAIKSVAKKNGSTVAVHPVDSAMPGTDESTAELVTVETTGAFQLMDPFSGLLIPHEGSTEVVKTQFIVNALASGQLKEV